MSIEESPSSGELFRDKVERVAISLSKTGVMELAKAFAVGGVVSFRKSDRELQSQILNFSEESLRLLETQGLSEEEAVMKTIKSNIAERLGDKNKDEKMSDAMFGGIAFYLPHRLADSYKGHSSPSCIDFALMNHLVLENMGHTGSRVVVFRDDSDLPTFALTYKGRILTYEQKKWEDLEKFRRSRRIANKQDKIFNIYPSDLKLLMRSSKKSKIGSTAPKSRPSVN